METAASETILFGITKTELDAMYPRCRGERCTKDCRTCTNRCFLSQEKKTNPDISWCVSTHAVHMNM